jgi:hypothetical protein
VAEQLEVVKMASVGVISEDGEVIEREVFSREANIASDNVGEINPSVTQRIKFDNKGQMSSITTECGETENRRQGNNKPKITVEGIIVESEIDDMRSLKNEEEITFISDIFKGDVIVERLSIMQKEDLIYFKPDGEEQELAFNFQLQLKQP